MIGLRFALVRPGVLLGLVGLLLASGCNTDLSMRENLLGVPQKITIPQQAAYGPARASLPAAGDVMPGKTGPGYLHFYVEPQGYGSLYGWQLRIYKSLDNPGFQPVLTQPVNVGASLRFDLWPGRYLVEVFHEGDLVYSEIVTIQAGARSLVYVEIGGFSDSVYQVSDPAKAKELAPELHYTSRRDVRQEFRPPELPLPGGYTGRWQGPLDFGRVVGSGDLEIFENGKKIATMPGAEVTPEGFKGPITFEDSRTIDRQTAPGPVLPAETRTRWPDGRQFEGSYKGLAPDSGVLTFADGSSWHGALENGAPTGRGRSVTLDGKWLDVVAEQMGQSQTGEYRCGRIDDPVGGPCFYVDGKQVNAAEFAHFEAEQAKIAEASQRAALEEARQAEAARKAAEEAARAKIAAAPPAPSPAKPAPSKPAPKGCEAPIGTFTDSTGHNELVIKEGGTGSLAQTTISGTSMSFFVPFRWSGAVSSMRFDYGAGEYRTASGQLVRKTSIPGGSTDCRYDGRVLTIGGIGYHRR